MTDASRAPSTTVGHLRRGGTSVVVRLDASTFPCILHWGPDLGELDADALDALQRIAARFPIAALTNGNADLTAILGRSVSAAVQPLRTAESGQ